MIRTWKQSTTVTLFLLKNLEKNQTSPYSANDHHTRTDIREFFWFKFINVLKEKGQNSPLTWINNTKTGSNYSSMTTQYVRMPSKVKFTPKAWIMQIKYWHLKNHLTINDFCIIIITLSTYFWSNIWWFFKILHIKF